MSEEKQIVRTYQEAKEEIEKISKAGGGMTTIVMLLALLPFLDWLTGDEKSLSQMIAKVEGEKEKQLG